MTETIVAFGLMVIELLAAEFVFGAFLSVSRIFISAFSVRRSSVWLQPFGSKSFTVF